MKRFSMMLAAAVMLAVPALAYDIGPAVGSKAPAITATTAEGKAVSMQALSGQKGLVLVFFRSAKWCPFCKAQLIDLNAKAPAALATRGYKMAALSYDSPDVLAKFAAERGITYPLLSDAGSKTIDAFGLRDPQYPADSPAYGVPEPAIFIVSPKGVIRAKLAEQGYKTRPPVEAVLAAIDTLPAQ